MIHHTDTGYNSDAHDSHFTERRVNFTVARIHFGEKTKKKSFRIIS